MSDEEKLKEAKQALHLLYLGQHVKVISEGGETVEFSPAETSQLEKYISRLEAQIGVTGNDTLSRRRGARSIRIL